MCNNESKKEKKIPKQAELFKLVEVLNDWMGILMKFCRKNSEKLPDL